MRYADRMRAVDTRRIRRIEDKFIRALITRDIHERDLERAEAITNLAQGIKDLKRQMRHDMHGTLVRQRHES